MGLINNPKFTQSESLASVPLNIQLDISSLGITKKNTWEFTVEVAVLKDNLGDAQIELCRFLIALFT